MRQMSTAQSWKLHWSNLREVPLRMVQPSLVVTYQELRLQSSPEGTLGNQLLYLNHCYQPRRTLERRVR